MEHSTNGMYNKNTSRYLYILRGPTKSVISRLILTCLHVYTGPGKRIENLEGKDL
jgi:hypothetical protein